jgi:hypothetical protein
VRHSRHCRLEDDTASAALDKAVMVVMVAVLFLVVK